MTEATADPRTTEGYSLPKSLHDKIREESPKRDMNRSDLVRKAVRFYFRSFPHPRDHEVEAD